MIKKTVILSVISFITLVLFHCPSFAEGLVSYWTCDSPDIVGTTVKDIAGSNHGIIQGTVPIVAGKFGEALQFGSLDSYVDCGNDASLNISSEITIEAWIKQFGIGGGNFNAGVVCKAQKGGTPWSWQLRYNFFPDGLYLGFQFNSPEGPRWVTAERGLTPGVWYHVVGTFNGSELKFYLNGAERDSNTMSGMITSDAPLLIGQDGWLNVFQGLVDEVKIYNRALSLHEIQQNYGVAPKLSVSPSEIDFGEESIQETFTINNTGGGLLLWQAAKQQTWLTISPDNGAIDAEETSVVTVSVPREVLDLGPSFDTINITSNGGNTSIPVSVIEKAVSFRNHLYRVVKKETSWHDAKSRAESLGGYLVTIKDKEENDFVCDLVLSKCLYPCSFWIGLTDEKNEGQFAWITNEPLTYTNWGIGEPNNSGGIEDYTEANSGNHLWNDVYHSTFPLPFVVEYCRDWPLKLNVTSSDASVGTISYILGLNSCDSGEFDIPLPPRPQPPIKLDAYIEGSNMFFPRLVEDYRQYTAGSPFNEIWIFHAYSDVAGFTLCWDFSNLPAGLRAVITQQQPPGGINMSRQTCFDITFDKGIEYVFTIQVSGTNDNIFTLDFAKGWNMASSPVIPVNNNIASLVNGTPVLPVAYTWDPDSQAYQQASILEFGIGYWFAATASTQLDIQLTEPKSILTRTLRKGWNMVGGVINSVQLGQLITNPPNSLVPKVYTYEPSGGKYKEVNEIIPGGGYWMAAYNNATLTMDSTAQTTSQGIALIASALSWEGTITASIAGTYPRSQELIFGQAPSALDGFDNMDAPLPPIGQPPIGIDAAFVINDAFFPRLSKDVKQEGDNKQWQLNVRSDSEDIRLTWDISNIPSEKLIHLKTGSQIINMRTVSFLELSKGIHTLTLDMATTQYLLTPGWNLISSCLDLDNDSISSFLGPIKDHCISVWEYGSWKHYSPSGPPSLNTLDKIEHGKGYWINMKDTGTLPMIGKEITNKGIQLYGGWNMAGYNSLTSQSCDSAISSISAYCICVWSYDNISKIWKCYFPGMPAVNTLTQFEPGKGYWINVSGNCLWDIGITNP